MIRYVESLREGLRRAMVQSNRVVVLGEDILDPYGGAFKVTKGLSTEFPDRVFPTPISESAIAGLATGLAARGYRPVAEIMFGDFLALCTDQIVNSATKFPLMYKNKVSIPSVIRTPMGGGRGYGPTHSQSLEKMFLGVPGLRVVAPSLAHDPGALLEHAVGHAQGPVLFIEEKRDYPSFLLEDGDGELSRSWLNPQSEYPTAVIRNFDPVTNAEDVAVLAYGGAAALVMEAMRDLKQEEIHVSAMIPSCVNRRETLQEMVAELTGNVPVFVAENGTAGFNWGGEIAGLAHESLIARHGQSRLSIRRLSAEADAVPAAKDLESKVILTKAKILESIYGALS